MQILEESSFARQLFLVRYQNPLISEFIIHNRNAVR